MILVAGAILPTTASAAGCGPWTYIGRIVSVNVYDYATGTIWVTTSISQQMIVIKPVYRGTINYGWNLYIRFCDGGAGPYPAIGRSPNWRDL